MRPPAPTSSKASTEESLPSVALPGFVRSECLGSGEGRGQQIAHTDRSMSARPRQLTLCVQRNLPVFVVGRQVFVSKVAVVPQLLVLSGPAGAVQRFGIQ